MWLCFTEIEVCLCQHVDNRLDGGCTKKEHLQKMSKINF